jgi:hypothetical protein
MYIRREVIFIKDNLVRRRNGSDTVVFVLTIKPFETFSYCHLAEFIMRVMHFFL